MKFKGNVRIIVSLEKLKKCMYLTNENIRNDYSSRLFYIT